jgi:hypothetical protein
MSKIGEAIRWAFAIFFPILFSAIFFRIVLSLLHRGWQWASFFVSGFGGFFAISVTSLFSVWLLTKEMPTFWGKIAVGVPAFLLLGFVQLAVMLVTFCGVGECF